MVEFISCFASDDDKKKNKISKKYPNNFNLSKNSSNYQTSNHININKDIDQQDIKNTRKTSLDLKYNTLKLTDFKEYSEEIDYGNIEFKLKIINSTPQKIEKLSTQMKFRLQEGQGQCIYEIGIEDNGNPLGLSEEELKISIATLTEIAEKLNAKISCFNFFKGKSGTIAEVLIKKSSVNFPNLLEIKIGLIGQESSGKSTLVIFIIYFFRSEF